VNADTGTNLILGRWLGARKCGHLGEGSMEGWRARLGIDIDDENTPTETYLSCPACAEGSPARLEPTKRNFRSSRPTSSGDAEIWPPTSVPPKPFCPEGPLERLRQIPRAGRTLNAHTARMEARRLPPASCSVRRA
jgi:hypothetical protein